MRPAPRACAARTPSTTGQRCSKRRGDGQVVRRPRRASTRGVRGIEQHVESRGRHWRDRAGSWARRRGSVAVAVTSARAIATRWAWPPESSSGSALGELGEADEREELDARSPRRRARARPSAGAGARRSRTRQRGQEAWSLEDDADGPGAGRRDHRSPAIRRTRSWAPGGPTSRCMSVLLPEPDGPTTAIWPRSGTTQSVGCERHDRSAGRCRGRLPPRGTRRAAGALTHSTRPRRARTVRCAALARRGLCVAATTAQPAAVAPEQQRDDLVGRRRVELARRLVREQQGRIVGEGDGEARRGRAHRRRAVRDASSRDLRGRRCRRSRARRRYPARPAELLREQNVGLDVEMAEQVRALEEHADRTGPYAGTHRLGATRHALVRRPRRRRRRARRDRRCRRAASTSPNRTARRLRPARPGSALRDTPRSASFLVAHVVEAVQVAGVENRRHRQRNDVVIVRHGSTLSDPCGACSVSTARCPDLPELIPLHVVDDRAPGDGIAAAAGLVADEHDASGGPHEARHLRRAEPWDGRAQARDLAGR